MSWASHKKPKATKPATRRGRTIDPRVLGSVLGAGGCSACPLDRVRLQHPKMLPSGPAKAEVYVLGEAPGATEDEEGEQFVGKSGKLLRSYLPRGAVVRFNNSIRCRPPDNRAPSPVELSCCRKLQEHDIENNKPKLILAVGAVPLQWLVKQDKITAWRGRLLPVQVGRHRCWAMPILHPAYVLRKQHAKDGDAVEGVFAADLKRAFAALGTLPAPQLESAAAADDGLVYCTKLDAAMAALDEVAGWKDYAIDLETSGLRPYHHNARILSVALSNYERTFCLPLRHRQTPFTAAQQDQLEARLQQLLLSGKRAIAHNSKFEIEWLAHRFGPAVVHECAWHDTMSQAYVLDEREGAKSLEALTLLHLGLNVKSLSKLNTARLDHEPLQEVLRYNGYDAKFTYPLYYLQHELLRKEKLLAVYIRHNQRVGPLALAQVLGLQPDPKQAAALHSRFEQELQKADAAIKADRDVQQFLRTHPEFNPGSPQQLKELFHGQLRFKQLKSEDGSFSTDEGVLSTIDHPVAKLILERRGLTKLLSTYIEPLLPGGKHLHDDGLVHTNFNHARTATSRLSSDEPNLQNLPIRTAEGKLIRRAFIAPKGYWFVSFDYGQIEARVIGMASKDRFLCNALWTGYDVHMEWAEKIARRAKMKLDKAGMKEFRSKVKNRWTFPLYFGASLKSACGYMELDERTIAPLYEEFWDTFADVHLWQRTLQRFYKEHGYVELLTGRRRHAPMGYNEILNTPIQGTASEIVIDSSVELSTMAYRRKLPHWQFRLNVHDDLGFYLPDRTLDDDIEQIAEVMCRPRFDFINVPLTVEVKVGRNWGEQEEVAVFSSTQWGHERNSV